MAYKNGLRSFFCFSVLGSLALAGCGESPSSVEAEAGRVFPAQTEAALDALIEEGLSFTRETGASYAIRGPRGERWQGAVGFADLRTSEPVRTSTRFSAGSNTKLVVAIATMRLVERGWLSLDDTLGRLLPEWSRWRDVTVRQLLGMQSGIPDYLLSSELQLLVAINHGQPFTPRRLLGFAHRMPRNFPAGEKCVYSNTNYLLLGLIIEKITGRRADEVIHEEVVKPLALRDTYLRTDPSQDAGVARGYLEFGLASAALGVPSIFRYLLWNRAMGDDVFDLTGYFHPSFVWTTGGLITTASDMAEVMHALFTGRLLRPETLEAMLQTRPCTIVSWPFDYGLGIYRRDTPEGAAWGHGGITYGYRAESRYLPGKGIAFSHMHNVYPTQDTPIEDEMLAIVSGSLRSPETTACKAPEGFPDLETNHRLNFAFRGSLNEGSTGEKVGVGWVRAKSDGHFRLYSGMEIQARRLARDSVEIVSDAPRIPDFSKARRALVRISSSPWEPVRAVLYEVTPDSPKVGQRMLCAEAASVAAPPVWLSHCSRPPQDVRPGSLFRVYGSVNLTRSRRELLRRLQELGVERCFCADENGLAIPCR